MPQKISIQIDSSEASDLIELFQGKKVSIVERIQAVEKELKALNDSLSRLDAHIAELSKTDWGASKEIEDKEVFNDHKANALGHYAVTEDLASDGYTELSWWRKTVLILKNEQRILSKREITEKLTEREPGLASKDAAKKRTDSVSIMSTLSTKATQGKLIRIESTAGGREEYKYGLPEWLDLNEQLYPRYK